MSEASGGKVAVLAKIPAQPGKRDELVKALQAAIDNANTEADTLLYILHIDDKDPDTVYFYELYTNQDALDGPRHERPLQGDRQVAARPRRRPSGADDPDAGHRQGALTVTYLDRIVARHREVAGDDDRPLDALDRRRHDDAAGAWVHAGAHGVRRAGRDRRDQAPLAVQGCAQRRPRPDRRRPRLRGRRGGVPVGAHRRGVLRRVGRRPRARPHVHRAARAAQGLHRRRRATSPTPG